MKTLLIMITAIFFQLFLSITFSQQLYTVNVPGTLHYIHYNPNNQSYGSGSNILYVGKSTNSNIYRSYIYWSNIRSYVPSGSQVVAVKFYITWSGQNNSSTLLEFRDFEFGSDISQTYRNISTGNLWGTKTANTIEYSFTQLKDRVQNAVNGGINDVWVGIKNQDENSVDKYVSYGSSVYIHLEITYQGPDIQVTQVDEDGNSFGQVGWWKQNRWEYINVPFTLNLQVGSVVGLQSDTNYKAETYQKYWKWTHNSNEYITNHHSFTILAGSNLLKATFKTTAGGVVIRNKFEGTSIDGGNIEFADPWLIDYPDPLFGNTKRNRGMKRNGDDALLFYSRKSPFNPSHQSHYKGVFLDQSGPSNNWQPPYYSVKATSVQNIELPHTGKVHQFYFQGWSASPAGSAEFQNANALETAVVFKQD